MRNSVSASARRFASPATWKTRSTPRMARRTARRSRTSHATCSTPRSARLPRRDRGRVVTRTLSPRCTSSRVTCDPTSPVAPVTKVTPTPRSVGGACRTRLRPMPEVAIVVDTTHYMPRALVEANGMREVSLYVNAGDRHERESDMPDFDAFYESLRTSAQLPTTSQPSIGDFLAVYEPLVEEGRDIVSVHISGGISGTVESARQAATDLTGRKPQRRIEV